MTIKTYKVYGADGHRQAVSFMDSFLWDFSKPGNPRIINCFCADKTGTNDFVIIGICRNTEEECDRELEGQISDGLFENCRVGNIIEIKTTTY